MTLVPPGWSLVGVVFDGQTIDVSGVDPWHHQRRQTGDAIEVAHPSYPTQRHTLTVWKVDLKARTATFAAGEVSNGVWCFYQPDTTL